MYNNLSIWPRISHFNVHIQPVHTNENNHGKFNLIQFEFHCLIKCKELLCSHSAWTQDRKSGSRYCCCTCRVCVTENNYLRFLYSLTFVKHEFFVEIYGITPFFVTISYHIIDKSPNFLTQILSVHFLLHLCVRRDSPIVSISRIRIIYTHTRGGRCWLSVIINFIISFTRFQPNMTIKPEKWNGYFFISYLKEKGKKRLSSLSSVNRCQPTIQPAATANIKIINCHWHKKTKSKSCSQKKLTTHRIIDVDYI